MLREAGGVWTEQSAGSHPPGIMGLTMERLVNDGGQCVAFRLCPFYQL